MNAMQSNIYLHKSPVAHSNYWTVRHRSTSSIRSIDWKCFWLASTDRMANFCSAYMDWLKCTVKLFSVLYLHLAKTRRKRWKKWHGLKWCVSMQSRISMQLTVIFANQICAQFIEQLVDFFEIHFTHFDSLSPNDWHNAQKCNFLFLHLAFFFRSKKIVNFSLHA